MSSAYTIRNPFGIYFITCTVVEWVDVFTRNEYREIVIESLGFCQREKGLNIHGWCLMSNHLHLIVSAQNGFDLKGIIRDFKKFTSSSIIKAIKNHSGESRRNWMLWIFSSAGKKNANNVNYQFWIQDNHAEELVSNDFMDQKLDYIHNNPVAAKIVDSPDHYIWSSARDYFGEKGLLPIVHIE